jgi:hypothetical protein
MHFRHDRLRLPLGLSQWGYQLTATTRPSPQFLDFLVGAKPQRIMWGCVGSRQSGRPPAHGRWWPNIAIIEDMRKQEQPVTAVEYEYRCAEYEHELKSTAAMR